MTTWLKATSPNRLKTIVFIAYSGMMRSRRMFYCIHGQRRLFHTLNLQYSLADRLFLKNVTRQVTQG